MLSAIPIADRPFVLDSNIILDAIVFPNGRASSCISKIKYFGCSIYVSDYILNEVTSRLKKIHIAYGIKFELLENLINRLISSNGIIIYPFASKIVPSGINKSDRPIASLQKSVDGVILTQDCRFGVECIDNEIPVNFPWQICTQIFNDETAHDQISADKGFVYMNIGFNFNKSDKSNHGLFDLVNFGDCFYKGIDNTFVFKNKWKNECIIKIDVNKYKRLSICVTWRRKEKQSKSTMYLSCEDNFFAKSKSTSRISPKQAHEVNFFTSILLGGRHNRGSFFYRQMAVDPFFIQDHHWRIWQHSGQYNRGMFHKARIDKFFRSSQTDYIIRPDRR